jgi:hypothetical protein
MALLLLCSHGTSSEVGMYNVDMFFPLVAESGLGACWCDAEPCAVSCGSNERPALAGCDNRAHLFARRSALSWLNAAPSNLNYTRGRLGATFSLPSRLTPKSSKATTGEHSMGNTVSFEEIGRLQSQPPCRR